LLGRHCAAPASPKICGGGRIEQRTQHLDPRGAGETGTEELEEAAAIACEGHCLHII